MTTEIEPKYTIDEKKWAPGNGSRRYNEPAPTPTKIKWDLRPMGEVGNLAGAGAREIARAEFMESQGAIIISETIFEGGGTQEIKGANGEKYERDFIFAEPIPMTEMTPHDPEAQGYAIPIWPIGQSLWLHGVEAEHE